MIQRDVHGGHLPYLECTSLFQASERLSSHPGKPDRARHLLLSWEGGARRGGSRARRSRRRLWTRTCRAWRPPAAHTSTAGRARTASMSRRRCGKNHMILACCQSLKQNILFG